MAARTKNALLFFLLLILSFPFAQHSLSFIDSGGLRGAFSATADVAFSWQKWIDGSYQHQKEGYLNDSVGFRPDLVRINNQLEFSLFDKCHAGWTILGRDNMLFQWPYIEAYYGNDFAGYDNIVERTRKLKALQDTLGCLGKSVILVYAASKATSYPEYFPANRVQKKRAMSNFDAYRRAADSLGVNQVDMDTWFVSMKNKSNEPLFAKQGIHWTLYGSILAADSLTRYIEKLRNIKVPRPSWSEMEHTTVARSGDDDVASELNLIFPVAIETFAYPVVRDVPDSGAKKPNVIYICDSYGFKMVGSGYMVKVNGQCECWTYFNEYHEMNGTGFANIKDYDWLGALNRSDCVVLVYTSFNLYQLGNGFIEAAYDHYYPPAK